MGGAVRRHWKWTRRVRRDSGVRVTVIELGGVNVEFVDTGGDGSVVLVAGYNHLPPDFVLDPMIRTTLADRGCRVVTTYPQPPDDPDEPGLSYGQIAEASAQLMSELGVESYSVFGFSMCSYIAQEVALCDPDGVGALILAAGGGNVDRDFQQRLALWAEAFRLGGEVARLALQQSAAEGAISPALRKDRDALNATYDFAATVFDPTPESFSNTRRFYEPGLAYAAEDQLPRLAAIRCPTLVAAAQADLFFSLEGRRQAAAAIPGAELLILERAPHHLTFDPEDTEIFHQRVLTLIA